jgi:hypothetical protein
MIWLCRISGAASEHGIPAAQLELLATWLDTEPDVPDGEWPKRFSRVTVCGEGELIKTFLLPGQAANGKRVS